MNKKIAALIMSIGMGFTALSANAVAPGPGASCEEMYAWCVASTCNPSFCQTQYSCGSGGPAH